MNKRLQKKIIKSQSLRMCATELKNVAHLENFMFIGADEIADNRLNDKIKVCELYKKVSLNTFIYKRGKAYTLNMQCTCVLNMSVLVIY